MRTSKSQGRPANAPKATASQAASEHAEEPAEPDGPRAPDGGPGPAPDSRRGPRPALRVLLMVLAFFGMVAFAVVLSRLTLEPSAASEGLTYSNLDPGASITNYLSQPAFKDAVKQLGGNIAMGVPFGILLPVLARRTRSLFMVLLTAALVMLLVELVQGALVTGRTFDIDDVILNTSGALLGYLLIGRRLGRAVHPRGPRWWQRRTKQQPEPSDSA